MGKSTKHFEMRGAVICKIPRKCVISHRGIVWPAAMRHDDCSLVERRRAFRWNSSSR